jgi:hypothetical protein
MEGVRTGARAVLRYLAPLFVVALVVQIFLAGEGIFGIKQGPKLDDQKTLDPHRTLGFILSDVGAIILLIVALLAWHPDRRIRNVSIALAFLLFIQGILGGAGRWGGAFHPLLAFVILGMFGALTHRLWRIRTATDQTPSVPVG